MQEKGFADALIGFISNVSTTGPLMVSVDTEARIVEVLFGIAAKLRLQPSILPNWFRPKALAEGRLKEQDFVRTSNKTYKDEFALFFLTLDYVHHDGRIGDFARTGLLYIVESATHSELLERWLVESDLATLMASGLGALYSQLSRYSLITVNLLKNTKMDRKLVVSFTENSVPAMVAFSEHPHSLLSSETEKTTSQDFQAHLATFLSYLVFWQDVLEHCSSSDVKQTLLDHFKYLFLQQLL